MSGLASGLQNQLHQFESDTVLHFKGVEVMNGTLDNRVLEGLVKFRSQSNLSCLLCKSPDLKVTGVFQPKDPIMWGAPQGKERYFYYALCDSCFNRPDRADAVENHISNEVASCPAWVLE